MSKFGDQFGDVVRGLLSLEINTVIKPGMTATRMPAPREAVIEVAERYRSWLGEEGRRPDRIPDGLSNDDSENPTAVAAHLVALAKAAELLRERIGRTASDSAVCVRVGVNGRQLAQTVPMLFKATPDPDELVKLRKIWEIGTEVIVMQTVISIEGDVVQRLNPDVRVENQAELLALHSAGVQTSVSYWQSLVSLLGSLFEGAWKLLTK